MSFFFNFKKIKANSLFKEETKVADGYYQNETIMLKELGTKYLPI
jgi:hypothetical protein